MSEVLVQTRSTENLNQKPAGCNAFCNEDVHSTLIYSNASPETLKMVIPRYFSFAIKVIDVVAAPEAPAVRQPRRAGWLCSWHDGIEFVPCSEGKSNKPFLLYFSWMGSVDPSAHGIDDA